MGRTYVELDGAKELAEILGALTKVVVEIAQDALTEWGKDVRALAQRGVPIDTGNLGSAIEARVDRRKLLAEVGVWEQDASYSQHVELGTSSQEPQPYLQPAFERHKDLAPYVREAWTRRVGA